MAVFSRGNASFVVRRERQGQGRMDMEGRKMKRKLWGGYCSLRLKSVGGAKAGDSGTEAVWTPL